MSTLCGFTGSACHDIGVCADKTPEKASSARIVEKPFFERHDARARFVGKEDEKTLPCFLRRGNSGYMRLNGLNATTEHGVEYELILTMPRGVFWVRYRVNWEHLHIYLRMDAFSYKINGKIPKEIGDNLSHLTAVSAVTNITTDEHALLSLKFPITSWSSSVTHVCNWTGVICNRHGRVAALSLSNMGLLGTIPPSMGNLSFLVSLDLRGNNFSGGIPKEMVHLRRIKYINLNFNDLRG
ncbi:hypothetical protein RJ640_027938, partial [Escallonia rubra]